MRKAILLAVLSLPLAAQGPYQPTAASLRTHKVPQWFDDAKFGIFIHWGPYAVPAFHEWYVAWMSPRAGYGFRLGAPPYTPDQGILSDAVFKLKYPAGSVAERARKYHLENFGPNVSYDDFLPMFKAEKFDPAAWAKLFEDAGARYVVLTAKHGDEFAMWPPKLTPRNAGDMGPKRDIVGDLAKTVRARGMKYGLYHNTTYTFYDKRYPGRDWVEYMNATIKELIDKYQPSVIWGDVTEGPIRDAQAKPSPPTTGTPKRSSPTSTTTPKTPTALSPMTAGASKPTAPTSAISPPPNAATSTPSNPPSGNSATHSTPSPGVTPASSPKAAT